MGTDQPGGQDDKTVGLARWDQLDALVGAAVRGEGPAIDSLLRWINPLVVGYCHARLGRQERTFASADDVAQEVCLAVFKALPHYRDQGRPFQAFVYGIAAHKVADAQRRIAAYSRADPVPELPDVPVENSGLEATFLNGELSTQLGQLLAELPERQRKIVVLRCALGLSKEETALAVGSTPGAVQVAQHRALARLRNLLKSNSTPDDPSLTFRKKRNEGRFSQTSSRGTNDVYIDSLLRRADIALSDKASLSRYIRTSAGRGKAY